MCLFQYEQRLTYAQAISVRAHEALPDKKQSPDFERDPVIRFDKIQGLDVAKIWALFRLSAASDIKMT